MINFNSKQYLFILRRVKSSHTAHGVCAHNVHDAYMLMMLCKKKTRLHYDNFALLLNSI